MCELIISATAAEEKDTDRYVSLFCLGKYVSLS